MAIINDLFFEHERGQKIGLWVLAIDMGLLFGPLSMYRPISCCLLRSIS